jgi:transcription elongation factor Elf1
MMQERLRTRIVERLRARIVHCERCTKEIGVLQTVTNAMIYVDYAICKSCDEKAQRDVNVRMDKREK